MKDEFTIGGFRVVADERVPKDEVWFGTSHRERTITPTGFRDTETFVRQGKIVDLTQPADSP
jgi:hypothetical protein